MRAAAPDAVPTTGRAGELHALAATRFERTVRISDAFFAAECDAVAEACRALATRFHRGGRLLAMGDDPAARTDAAHVAVEFVHPVLVGKRALPALALEGPWQLRLLGRRVDALLAIAPCTPSAELVGALEEAGRLGMLTLALTGGTREAAPAANHVFVVPEADPTVVQEVGETLYHVLWELVHVYFDHEELLG